MGDQEDVLGFDSFMEREVDTGYRLLDVDQLPQTHLPHRQVTLNWM